MKFDHKILFVDDEKKSLERIRRSLDLPNYNVSVQAASTIEEATELFKNRGFDIVITDFEFRPDKEFNGIDIIQRISEIDSNVQTFLYTRNSPKEELKRVKHLDIQSEDEFILNLKDQLLTLDSFKEVGEQIEEIRQKEEERRSDSENHVIQIDNDIKIVNSGLLEMVSGNPDLLNDISWRQFEELIAEVLESLNYEVILGSGRNDGGKDMLAIKKDVFFHTVLAVECKHYTEQKVGRPAVQKLLGVVEGNRYNGGLLVNSSFFTREAIEFATPLHPKILLKDITHIEKALNDYRNYKSK